MNVGDKVICVDDSVGPQVDLNVFPTWVKEGDIYTVRALEGSLGGGRRVILEEIKNPSAYFPELMGKTEPGFNQKRFADLATHLLKNAIGEEVSVGESLEIKQTELV